ncbi:hypothetical protein DUI87_16194 [Hirundo rustica rustica]|uniref:Uncharacterized protein n=1 Tax=Hirundo rustica rustica TaxID=333673 RepID=A0A3M0K180_HIRRU|nr:hypothetical protein DUI87_16194 [Hirundo rustica rustica]
MDMTEDNWFLKGAKYAPDAAKHTFSSDEETTFELSLKLVLSQTRNGGKENGPKLHPFIWPDEKKKGTNPSLNAVELMDVWCIEKHNTYPGPFSQEA